MTKMFFICLVCAGSVCHALTVTTSQIRDDERLVPIEVTTNIDNDPDYAPGYSYKTEWLRESKLEFSNGLLGTIHDCFWYESGLENAPSYDGTDAHIIVSAERSYMFVKMLYAQVQERFLHNLSVNDAFDFSDTPTIEDFQKETETSQGWIYNSYRYRYRIGLSDGSRWKTSWQTRDLDSYAFMGKHVVMVGTPEERTLICIDPETTSEIHLENCFFGAREKR